MVTDYYRKPDGTKTYRVNPEKGDAPLDGKSISQADYMGADSKTTRHHNTNPTPLRSATSDMDTAGIKESINQRRTGPEPDVGTDSNAHTTTTDYSKDIGETSQRVSGPRLTAGDSSDYLGTSGMSYDEGSYQKTSSGGLVPSGTVSTGQMKQGTTTSVFVNFPVVNNYNYSKATVMNQNAAPFPQWKITDDIASLG